MPVIAAPTQPTHEAGPNKFTSLATPSRGSTETSVWQVVIPPNTEPNPHSVSREEVFVVQAGRARVSLDGVEAIAETGDAIVLPSGVMFELHNAGNDDLRLLCCMPVGGEATLANGTTFPPPWSL
jgi:quercetin dioxygenase-like cupin family protein